MDLQTIEVKASKKYEVIIGDNLLANAGRYILDCLGKACTIVLVSDDTVAALYADKVSKSLLEQGFSVEQYIFPHGEQSKTVATVSDLWRFMAEKQITRTDVIVALGGGVTGDLSGFAAASYLRGIRFVQIPTTLLAMVDASVGGKTAVDLPQGKNLVGAFWQPELVLCDYKVLETLPREYVADGMAEVIKYGFIGDKELLTLLDRATMSQLDTEWEEIITRAIVNKKYLVEADERDKGARQLLNLGHTLGHAVEKCSDFQLSHGQAVAIGMVWITKAAMKRGICKVDVLPILLELLQKYNLPIDGHYDAVQITQAALNDKKRTGETLNLVVPREIGQSELYAIKVADLENFVRDGIEYAESN